VYLVNRHRNSDIWLTDAAIARMHEQILKQGCAGIRLSLKEAGCSGMEYVVDFFDIQQDALSSGFVFINPNKKANVAAEFLSACDVQIAQLQSKAHVNVIQTSNMPH